MTSHQKTLCTSIWTHLTPSISKTDIPQGKYFRWFFKSFWLLKSKMSWVVNWKSFTVSEVFNTKSACVGVGTCQIRHNVTTELIVWARLFFWMVMPHHQRHYFATVTCHILPARPLDITKYLTKTFSALDPTLFILRMWNGGCWCFGFLISLSYRNG